MAFEINRQYIDGAHLEDTWSVTTGMGLLGIEKNMRTGEWFIGSMPNGLWALGGGVSSSMKIGFTF